MKFEDIISRVKSYNQSAGIELISKAYHFAEEKHRGQKRLSGDPFITHPLETAYILTELEQDVPTICAALLHDTVEDLDIKLEELSRLFSPEISALVAGVTKLGQLVYESREERQAENYRKMFMAMGRDLRVVIIKLADRLHNMRTLEFLPPRKRNETALETREIFAPLAHRLGMWKMKWELEDLAFRFLEHKEFENVKRKISLSRKDRESYISQLEESVRKLLLKVQINAYLYGRPKHFFSIHRKMVDQNLEFEEIYDLTAIRILVESVRECYAVLGVIHAAWRPIAGRFKDYIAVPKSNGYQSLHTTVIGPGGRPVEIQIRTKQMHRIAEYGIAAHWVYKEKSTDKEFDLKMSWFRRLLENQSELKDAKDIMESLKIDLFTDEVFVYTPKGNVFQLPVRATPIDFAYHVHTQVGHRACGAKINGRIVPLDHQLQNGDIIEIMTGKTDAPSLDWLNFVKTSSARTRIKSWLKKHRLEEKTEEKKIEEIKPAELPKPRKRKIVLGIRVSGLSGVLARISKCCKPLPGDKIIGIVSKGRGVSVHRDDCKTLSQQKVNKEKIVDVSWDLSQDIFYPVEIDVEAFDRVGVFKDILAQISNTDTNVSSASVTTKRGSSALLHIVLDIRNVDHLGKVLAAIRGVSDVFDVYRADASS
ncbi:MAG: bifunctional (p)ppGpp synthetase/guanosine-3',5'-bis(diphosphate) 3'-pyrophosphohydrolase [Candidatus Saganbacteria bacterium]|nr:bifunctional (p)ppGpp synthetase/guanosine-3',5'-bis(diphosphate) 3'-pyrophosphohydrolase [Candidatus Saganbacteria bacterium]